MQNKTKFLSSNLKPTHPSQIPLHIMAKIVYIRILQCPFNELSDVVQANRNTFIGRCATNRYFQVLGNIHDIESYSSIDHTFSCNVQIFLCHWGHLAIIFMWVSGNLFHIGWNGNYELWKQNPIGTLPIAGSIWDPHFGSSGSGQHMNIAYNGIYALLYTLGFNSVSHLYNLVIATELLAVISILLAFSNAIHLDSLAQWVRHHSPISLQLVSTSFSQGQGKVYNGIGTGIMRLLEERLNFHTYGAGIGFLSIAWAGHFLHLCGIHSNLDPFQVTNTLSLPVLLTKRGSRLLKGSLGFHGGLKPDTMSLYLTDIAHHHLAVGILFVLSAHVYSSLYKGFGHGVRDVLFVKYKSGCSTHLFLNTLFLFVLRLCYNCGSLL
jgi:photosystem I P700 chlorophyll a apoprotein A2